MKKSSEKLAEVVRLLSLEELQVLAGGLKMVVSRRLFKHKQARTILESAWFQELPQSIQYLIGLRFPSEEIAKVISSMIVNTDSVFHADIVGMQLEYKIQEYLKNVESRSLLKQIKEYYCSLPNCWIYPQVMYWLQREYRGTQIPIEIARDIMKESRYYPRIIASMAERSCRLYANEALTVVGEIANRDQWFD